MTAQQVIAEEPLKKVRSVFGTRVDLALDLANGLQVILEGRDVVISAEDTKIMLFGEIPAVHIMSFRNGPWYICGRYWRLEITEVEFKALASRFRETDEHYQPV